MTIANNNVVAKIAAVVAGLGLVAMSFATFAVPAQADTTSDLQAQISSLLAQIAALQSQLGTSTTTTASTTFTRDLTTGSTGADVTALQSWLIAKGYSIPAGATGYFGAQTVAALAAYQAANGISPAAGYFGPVTRAKVNASAGTTTTTTTGGGTTTTTTTLKGGEADLTNFDLTSGDGSVNSNAQDAELANAKFDVDGGDISVQRAELDATVDPTGDASDKPWNYFDTISVMADGKTIGHVDASDRDAWDEQDDGTYRITVSGLNYVVKDGDRAELTFAADIKDLDDNEAASSVAVSVNDDGIRAVDAAGIQQYVGDDSDHVNVSFDTEDNGDLTVREGSDNPSAGTILADDNAISDDLTVLDFQLRNSSDADTDLNEIDVDVDSTASGYLDDIINRATLTIGDNDYDGDVSHDNDGTGTISFNDLDETVDANDNLDATLTIRLARAGTSFDAGNKLTFTVVGDAAHIDAEGSDSGDELTDSDIGGTVTSDDQTIVLTDVSVDPTSASAGNVVTPTNTDADTSYVTYTLKFDVTAGDDDVFVPTQAAVSSSTAGVLYSVTGDSFTGDDSATLTQSGATKMNHTYRINAGDTAHFTLVVTLNPAASGTYGVRLNDVRFNDADSATSGLTDVAVDQNSGDVEAGPTYIPS